MMISKKELKKQVLDLLSREEIDDNESFIKYGGDSLFFGRLQIEIKKTYGLRIPIRKLFSNGSINGLYTLLSEYGVESEEKKLFKMTDLQRAYSLGRKDEMILGGRGSHAYFAFEGEEIDEVRLEAAIKKLVTSQEMLRAGFENDDTMYISDEPKVYCEYKDLRGLEENEKRIQSEILSEELFRKVFDEKKGPLIYFLIVRMNELKTIVHVSHDGIIADGESHQIILKQLEDYYYGRCVDNHISFVEYADYLSKLKNTAEYEEARKALSSRFDGYDLKPQLPLRIAPENVKKPEVKIISKYISEEQYENLCEVARNNGVTIFALLFTIFAKAVGKYSYNSKYIINLPVAQRPVELEGIDNLVGLCSNFILLDFDNNKKKSLIEQIEINQEKIFEIREYGMSFMGTEQIRLLRNLRKEETIAPIVFTSTLDSKMARDAHFKKVSTKTYTSQVWIEGLLTRIPGGVLFTLSYVDELFEHIIPERIADYFIETLKCIEENEEILNKVSDIPLIEKDRKLIEKCNSITKSVGGSSFYEKMKINFSCYRDKTAIIDKYALVTYDQLERFCNNMGVIFLQKYELKKGDIVGVYMPKNAIQVACEIALAYMGITFIPLDYELPEDAIKHCVKNIGIKLVVTDQASSLAYLNEINIPIFRMTNAFTDYCQDAEEIAPLQNEEMILINTSGTTGFPKTVKLNKESIIHCIVLSEKIFGITPDDIIFNLTNYSHDMSIFDILGIPYIGGTIVVPDQEDYKNPDAWLDLMIENSVTVWNSVPAFREMLILGEEKKLRTVLNKIKVVIQGGDYLQVATVQKIKEISSKCRVFNVGGPTETTIWNIYHEVTSEDIANGKIPYGKPFPNAQYFILDKDMQLCPIEKEGIMYIAGEGVSIGYVGEIEEDKFVQYKGVRVYNSGDCGKYLENGEILFLGRKDRQIKLNGKRIELDGIEKAMSFIDGIDSVAVVFQRNQKKIVAFYTSHLDIHESRIKEELALCIPDYMLPANIYRLNKMPINRNGKVNRKELELYQSQEKKDIVSVSSTFEKKLINICQEIFWETEINLQDDFYTMGGDSVSAMRMAAKVREQFGIKLSPYDIFEHPNIKSLAEYISTLKES